MTVLYEVSHQNCVFGWTEPRDHFLSGTYLLSGPARLLLVDIQVPLQVCECGGAGQGDPRLRVQDHVVLVHSSDIRGVCNRLSADNSRRYRETHEDDNAQKHGVFPDRRECCEWLQHRTWAVKGPEGRGEQLTQFKSGSWCQIMFYIF